MTAALQLSERFKPVRAGLLNLFEYGNQVFEFADGHLLLRGHNGAGKSKALELLLPFVLDGDTHPNKLDPFATGSREMKWNLTLDGRHDSRWGYAWLEFGRQSEGATPEWVTLAVGIRAHQQTPGSQTWFLVIPDRRLGHDLTLVNSHMGTPVARRGIRAELGEDVEVFDEAYAYRERVNEVLFGFPTVERYENMLELQRQLRRPQLSKSLNPEELSNILTDALPEVDGRLIADIGAHLDTIEQLRQDLRALTSVRDGFGSFVDTYQAYARAIVAERASAVVSADRDARQAQGELDSKRQAAHVAQQTAQDLERDVESLTGQLQLKRGAEQEHARSGTVRSAKELAELREQVSGLETQEEQLTDGVRQARDEANAERCQRDQHQDEQRASDERAQGAEVEMREFAGIAGLEHHEVLTEQLRASDRPETLAKTLRDEVVERRRDISRQRELRAAAEREGVQAAAREDAAGRAEGHVRDAESRLAVSEDELVAQRQALVEAAQDWVENLNVLVLSDQQTEQLLDTAATAGDPDVSVRAALAEPERAHEASWMRTQLQLQSEQEHVAEERAPLAAERDELNALRTPEPEIPYTRTADRSGRAGAPLWQLVDFHEGVPAEHRAGLEAALEGAGLLDAWVLPDGRLLDVDGDIALTVSESADGRQLNELLRAVDGNVTTEVINGVLAAVGLGDTGATGATGATGRGVRVDVDGRFRLGPAVGSYTKAAAQFIGASAREANRKRRLAELASLLAALDERDNELIRSLATISDKRAALAAELVLLPNADGVRSAYRAVRDIERSLATLRRDTQEARRAANKAAEVAANARKAAADHARERRMPAAGIQPSLETLESALGDYASRIGDLVGHTRSATQCAAQATAAEDRAKRADGRAELLDEQHQQCARKLQGRRGALEALEATEGKGAEAALEQLAQLQTEIETLDLKLGVASKDKENAAVEHAKLETLIEGAQDIVEQRLANVSGRLQHFRALEAPDFLRLAVDDEAPTVGAIQQWTAGQVQRFARTNAEVLRTTLAVEALTNRVEEEYTRLLGELDGSVGVTPFRQRHDGLDVVAATRGERQVSMRVLLTSLDEEIDAQQRNLTEADQRTFERFLFSGIAQHLRSRISSARQLVEDTNAAMARCQTSSGMSVELSWDPMADDDALLRRALQLLKANPDGLSPTEREQLIRFFRERVENARLSQDEGTATEHLLGALDYRHWHRFVVLQTKDGVKVPLTKKQHEAGSGGEKAAALHLPLFAAASAHMKSAAEHAPRLVMLDEAFAGIDGKMRPQLLGLIEAFDLDFMLTSHELWCCERELEHLSIYQLHREEGVPGIATVHFLWDGAAGKRTEVDSDEDLAA